MYLRAKIIFVMIIAKDGLAANYYLKLHPKRIAAVIDLSFAIFQSKHQALFVNKGQVISGHGLLIH